jgi:hypothetical protein
MLLVKKVGALQCSKLKGKYSKYLHSVHRIQGRVDALLSAEV